MFVNDAKEDLKPKEGTVKVLQEYLQQSNEVMIKILEASVVKSMGDRFALLVSEFVNRPNNNLQRKLSCKYLSTLSKNHCVKSVSRTHQILIIAILILMVNI